MPAGQPLLLGQTGPLHRGQVGGGGHRPTVGVPGGGGGGGGGPPATGGRGGGGGYCARGALRSHPSAIGLSGNLVQEVQMRAGGNAAEDVRPPGGGLDLSPTRTGRPTRRR